MIMLVKDLIELFDNPAEQKFCIKDLNENNSIIFCGVQESCPERFLMSPIFNIENLDSTGIINIIINNSWKE